MADQVFLLNIFDNMSDGVMTIEGDGQITMFNQAAADILGVTRSEVLGNSFAQVFMLGMDTENDDFNQLVLDAVYKDVVDHQSIVDFCRPDGTEVNLSLTASYLVHHDEPEEGEKQKGIIIVVNDITKLHKLQKSQEALNNELITACRQSEASNRNLNNALRKVRVIRRTAAALILGVTVGLGAYFWQQNPAPLQAMLSSQSVAVADSASSTFHTVTTSPLASHVSMSGVLVPLEKINIVAPFKAAVKKRFFQFGSTVRKGEPLLELNTNEFEITLRNAEADYMKAQKALEDLIHWTSGMEMSQVNRSLLKAQRNLDGKQRKLKEAQFLFDKGILSANEYESQQEAVENAQLELIAAKEQLATVKKKGSRANIKIAQMALTNAEIKKKGLEEKLQQRILYSPVSGIVLEHTDSGSNQRAAAIEQGASVTEGQVLFSVGNLAGMSISSYVDENDIGAIRVGQEVTVMSEAFGGITLQGEISAISYQAKNVNNTPMFGVKTIIRKLSDAQRAGLRLGMSASLQVKVYENPDALLIPIAAVQNQGMATPTVMVRSSENGQLVSVPVHTGLTTMNSVEIKKGLRAGDVIALGY